MRSVVLMSFFFVAAPLLAGDKQGLPIVEVPAHVTARTTVFAVLISGDGGWAKIDKSIAERLAAQGIPVVGLNSLQYFWTKRAPDTVARDVGTLIDTYSSRWKVRNVLLIGYSRGADILPFVVSRLPETMRRRVALVALLSPSKSASFEFKVADWFKDRSGVATKPEIDKLRGTKTICVYGTDDRDTVCTDVDASIARPIPLSGSHHFDRDYDALARIISSEVKPQ
jgi:type IV secretory pathway VirJ component